MRSLTLSKKLFFFVYIFLGLCVFGLESFGQSPALAEIQASYTTYEQQGIREKMYVHTDRQVYVSGEIIWFKAYLANAENNRPLGVSKVSYVELVNKANQPVLQGKIAMKEGSGNGSFLLPASIASGNYILRAYTNWMKNFSPDYFFEKKISIINSSANIDSSSNRGKVAYNIDFFPEGGNLVTGLESKIAFKAVDNKNNGAECEGVIINEMKDTVATFATLRFGMGRFSLKPESGKQYTAIANFKDGSSLKKELPQIYSNGYVMQLNEADLNNLRVSISANGNYLSRNMYVVVQSRGHIDVARSVPIENNNAVCVINKNELKEGVSIITVFDENKTPLCERLYFSRPKNKMVISAKADKATYETRSKVIVNVSTDDQNKNPLTGNLSASVYRLGNIDDSSRENIFNYFWLTSNLRGFIEDPGYYFAAENAETGEALENLLLAQGWRKFNWDDVLQNKKPSFTYVPEFAGHIITGKVINAATKKPASDVQVYLSVPGKRIQLRGCKSDAQGLVHFDMKDFFGASQLVMQTNEDNDSVYHLEIFSPFFEKFSQSVPPGLNISSTVKNVLAARHFNVAIQNTYHQSRLQEMSAPVVDTIPFFRKPYKTYVLSDYTRFVTMEEVMREYVAEVNVRRNGSKFRLATFNSPAFETKTVQVAEQVFSGNPLVLLDGVPVFDINKIIAYDPLKVYKLDIVAEKYHLGTITAEGILSYTTYNGRLEDLALNPNDLVLDYEGLQQQRVFYSPQYENASQRAGRLPDFRNVLFWNPDVKTNSNGKGAISFYTGDIPGRYVVVLQGLASNGNAGNYSTTFDVMR